MKRIYQSPQLEISYFHTADIVCSSIEIRVTHSPDADPTRELPPIGFGGNP